MEGARRVVDWRAGMAGQVRVPLGSRRGDAAAGGRGLLGAHSGVRLACMAVRSIRM